MTQLVIPWNHFDNFEIWHNDRDKQVVCLTGRTKTVKAGGTTFCHAAMYVNVPYTKLPMPDEQHKRAIRYAVRTGDKELQNQIYSSVIARYSKPKRYG